jgi:hypothetical protein
MIKKDKIHPVSWALAALPLRLAERCAAWVGAAEGT